MGKPHRIDEATRGHIKVSAEVGREVVLEGRQPAIALLPTGTVVDAPQQECEALAVVTEHDLQIRHLCMRMCMCVCM